MPSRMDRYYNNTRSEMGSRSRRNSSLYDNIYDGKEYSNVRGITTIEKNNEIDLDKIKELLKEHEESKNVFRSVARRPVEQIEYDDIQDEKNYDVMEVLSKAKDNYVEDNKNRSIKDTQYNILKNIDIKNTSTEDEQSLKELINTITSTSILNKLGDKDLSLDMLENLKSDENTIVGARGTNDVFKNEIESAKNEDDTLDKSFFTSSLSFNDSDFEQLNDIKSSLKKNNILISILVFIFLALIITGILFALYNLK